MAAASGGAQRVERNAPPSGAIVGTVRSATTGASLAGAVVTTGDGEYNITIDSMGTYALRQIPVGTGEIRVVCDGYYPLALAVTVPAHGTVRVDMLLTPHAATLATIQILAIPPLRFRPLVTLGTMDSLGSWQWRGSAVTASTGTGEPDVFRLLADDPAIMLHPEGASLVTSRGGSGNEALVLVDGFPIWSPLHAGGGLSVVTPDAVDGLTFHDGVMPARYGGKLGSVLDMHTRDLANDSLHGSVAFGSTASRIMMASPWQSESSSGNLLLAIRRSNSDLFATPRTGQPFWGRWSDGIAALALTRGATTIQFLTLASTDRLDPRTASIVLGTWQTRTSGMLWRQKIATNASLDTRLWQADFSATPQYAADSVASALNTGIQHRGAESQLTWGHTTVGTSIERLDTHYRVTWTTAGPTTGQPLALQAAPTLTTAFAEQRWGAAQARWMARMGVRATWLRDAPTAVDPRVAGAIRITDRVMVTAGYTRAHQFIQSLRNQNAPISTFVGIDLPAATGPGSVPVAQSDAGAAAIHAQLSAHSQLSLAAYTRRMTGLAIADPASQTLYADRTFETGFGRSAGAGARLNGQIGRVTWQTMYGVGRMRYTMTSRPTALAAPPLSHAITAALTAQLGQQTQCRLVGWRATGAQAGQVFWWSEGSGATGSGGVEDDQGSSHELRNAYSDVEEQPAHRPVYMRVDLHLTHDWQTGPGRGTLSAFLTLANLFNRTNVAAYSADHNNETDDATAASGARALPPMTLTPRSLLAGVSWRF